MMHRTGLLFHVFPELEPLVGLAQNRWHHLDAFEHTLACVQEADTLQAGCERIGLPDRLSPEESELLKWAALYHDTGKAETARKGADGEVHFHGHEVISASLAQRALSRLHVGQSAIIALGVAGVMVLAGFQLASGLLTVGDLVLINAYVIQICLPLNSLGFVYRETHDALTHTETLFRLLRRTPEMAETPELKPLQVSAGEVRFESVVFSYAPGRWNG